jgi:pantoate--beta-alanine ligase
MRSVLLKEPLAKIDYAEIVDAETFEPVVKVNNGSYALLAVYIGRTRLIDNLFIDVQGDQVRTEL